MARKKSTFTYENQAKLSIILAAIGGLGTLAAIALLARNFTNMETFWVAYNPKGMWLPTLAGALLVGVAASTGGFFVGLNSAGQRRNEMSRLSWIGFFANAGVITLALCAGVFFFFTRYRAEV